MEKSTTYVEFLYGGWALTKPIQVLSRDIESLQIPPGSIGLRFCEVALIDVTTDDVEKTIGVSVYDTITYYFGYIYTAEQVADLVLNSDHLVEAMLNNDVEHLILLVNGTWYPYDPNTDAVLSPDIIGREIPSQVQTGLAG